MPNLDPRPFGGNALSGGLYGTPPNPQEWQHQPGDHSDTGILPLLTPISASGGVAFGFSTSATGAETFTGTGGVTFAFSTAATATETFTGTGAVEFPFSTSGTGTAGAAVETTFCDYDYAADTYDNADDSYDCGALAQPPNGLGWFDRGPDRPRTLQADDEDDALVLALTMRRRFRL